MELPLVLFGYCSTCLCEVGGRCRAVNIFVDDGDCFNYVWRPESFEAEDYAAIASGVNASMERLGIS